MRRIAENLNFRSKATLCILIPTATALAFQASNSNSNSLLSFRDSSSESLDFREKIRTVIHGFRRSSRAISTISLIVIDYKYSLNGLVANSDEYRSQLSEVHLRSAKRLLKLCQINKGFYVKAGQFAASLQQSPKEYSSTLSSLQDQAVPCPFKDIKEVLIRNLGSDISTIFLSLDEQPIAAASIAQVHRAILKNNQEVAIKEWTTRQVLIMEFCEGHKVDDIEFMKQSGINPTEVAKALVEMFAEMIFIHGFLHGDPHPGNILVSPDNLNGFALVLLDHGIYKQLDEEFRLDYCQLWKALIILDTKKIQQLGERFGILKYYRYFPLIFTGRTFDSKSALGRGMSNEEKRNLKEELKLLKMEDISSFMESLPPDFLTVLRTDGLLRSIIRKLGVSRRIRMLTYAKYALHGLSPKLSPETDTIVKVAYVKLKTTLSYLHLRIILGGMEVLSNLQKLCRRIFHAVKSLPMLSFG